MHPSPLSDDPKTDTRHVPPSISDRNARLIALLDSFDDGDPEQQRRDFAALQAGLEASCHGQDIS